MRRLNPIEPRHLAPEVRASLSKIHSSTEEVPNFLRLLAKSLAATRAFAGMEHSLAGGELSPRERQQTALAVAEINGCSYSLIFHTRAAREAALTEEDIRLARKAAAEDPRENAMLRFVQSVVLQRGDISDKDLSLIKQAGFSESEIIEIVANIAENIFKNYVNIISNTEADAAAPRALAAIAT